MYVDSHMHTATEEGRPGREHSATFPKLFLELRGNFACVVLTSSFYYSPQQPWLRLGVVTATLIISWSLPSPSPPQPTWIEGTTCPPAHFHFSYTLINVTYIVIADSDDTIKPKKLNWLTFRLMNDTEIAKAKRDFELKKAAYDVEVQTKVIR